MIPLGHIRDSTLAGSSLLVNWNARLIHPIFPYHAIYLSRFIQMTKTTPWLTCQKEVFSASESQMAEKSEG